jgi:acetyl esterase/lipase
VFGISAGATLLAASGLLARERAADVAVTPADGSV